MNHPSQRISVVLHRPIYPRNIGMCARAVANMGYARLVAVAPQCEIDAYRAKQGAANAQETLRGIKRYDSLKDFYSHEGEGLRIALSGRRAFRNHPAPLDLELAIQVLAKETTNKQGLTLRDPKVPVYLFFGPENDGLSQEEMSRCHYVCHLPTGGPETSLSLSHAVLLALFVVQKHLPQTPAPRSDRDVSNDTPRSAADNNGSKSGWASDTNSRCKVDLDTREEGAEAYSSYAAQADRPSNEGLRSRWNWYEPLYYPDKTIRLWLEALGFDLSAPRVNIENTLNRILLSNSPRQDELRLLDSVLHQTIRKLNVASSRESKQ